MDVKGQQQRTQRPSNLYVTTAGMWSLLNLHSNFWRIRRTWETALLSDALLWHRLYLLLCHFQSQTSTWCCFHTRLSLTHVRWHESSQRVEIHMKQKGRDVGSAWPPPQQIHVMKQASTVEPQHVPPWLVSKLKKRGGPATESNLSLTWHSLSTTIRSVTKSRQIYCRPWSAAARNRARHLQSVIIKALGENTLFVSVLLRGGAGAVLSQD